MQDTNDNEIERLEAIYSHQDIHTVSVMPYGDGLVLDEECSRVDGRPAIEIPHPDPHFEAVTEEYATFDHMLWDHGCETVDCGDFTYIVSSSEGENR